MRDWIQRGADAVDAVLRGRGAYASDRSAVPYSSLVLIVWIGGFGYGAMMGSWGARPLQALYAGLKVPLLLGASSAVCLPSFVVVNTVLGLRDDLSAVLKGLLCSQATLVVRLMSLAPLTLLAYISNVDYAVAIGINGIVFAVAAFAAQSTLRRHYRPLVVRNPRHQVARRYWAVLYVFISIQTAWVLRPYIGAPSLETHFFRCEAWSNAYLAVFDMLAAIF